VGKLIKPGKEGVALRPSRIRRDPPRPQPALKPPPSRERVLWTGIAGVVVLATACAALLIGLSEVTSESAAAKPAGGGVHFGYCQATGGPNCVDDGDTFFLAREQIDIAGIDAPEIRGAKCPAERSRGIEAAVKLHDLLNDGTVTVLAAADAEGRTVEVDGRDVGRAMVAASDARDLAAPPWTLCSN